MKFAAVLCVILALFGQSLALKDPICAQPSASDLIRMMSCRFFFPSWSYYPEDNACKWINYGDCGGNVNYFLYKEECEAKCKE